MSNKTEMNEVKAEEMIQSVIDWLASGAQGTDIDEKYCFGTIPQDLALGFAQEMLGSVGIDASVMMGIASNLASNDNVVVPCLKRTIH